jgi:vacuolar-type H+-ATPase subunit F/Vma7
VGALFIGSQAECAGWRLAGLDTIVCAPQETDAREAFTAASATADLVVLAAPIASLLRAAEIAQAQRAPRPLLVVLPASADDLELPLLRDARRQLGMDVG